MHKAKYFAIMFSELNKAGINMNIVEQAIERHGSQAIVAEKLSQLTGHEYKQPHVAYWKRVGGFPAEIAGVVASGLFDHEISAFDASPKIKRAVAK